MKLRHLEIQLEKVGGFQSPKTRLEQYPTPAPLAARLLFHAAQNGDITGMDVCDPGCGTGTLAIGAALLGARGITGIDCDGNAIQAARNNAAGFGVRIDFIQEEISEQSATRGHWDTIVMNPPFGAQKCHADRVFIDFALRSADITYMIANRGSIPFVHSYVQNRAEILETFEARLPIKHLYHFHKKDVVEIPVEILHLRSLSHEP